MANNIVEFLGFRGEKILSSNIQPNENILVKLKGSWGEGLVITNLHIYIIKWGRYTGNFIGGKCSAFNYPNLVGIEIRKGFSTGTLELLSSATMNINNQGRLGRRSRTLRSNYIIAFSSGSFKKFQDAAVLGRELILKHHNRTERGNEDDEVSKLERLSALKDKGAITEEEYTQKKKQILGLDNATVKTIEKPTNLVTEEKRQEELLKDESDHSMRTVAIIFGSIIFIILLICLVNL